jgi:hypothetical protein
MTLRMEITIWSWFRWPDYKDYTGQSDGGLGVKKVCIIEGCSSSIDRHGLCKKHFYATLSEGQRNSTARLRSLYGSK